MILRATSKLSPESCNMILQEYSKYVSMEPKRSAVSDVFMPLVQILRLFGHCPLTYRKNGNVGQPAIAKNCMPELAVYEYRWENPWNIWTACCLVLYAGMWAIFAAEGLTGFRLYNDDGVLHQSLMVAKLIAFESGVGSVSGRTLRLVFQTLLVVYGLMQVSECALAWAEAKSFANFLNGWASYEQSIRNCFQDYDTKRSIKGLASFRRNLLVYYTAVPFCSLTLLLALGFPSGFLIAFVYVVHVSVGLVEDAKVILSCEVIAVHFRILNEAIHEVVAKQDEKFTVASVGKWKHLVLFLRKQVVAAGDYQKYHQLSVLVCSVFLISSFSFVLLNGTFESEHAGTIQALVGFVGLVCVVRVYGKVLAAERIINEELALAKQLEGVAISENQLGAQLEMNFIHDIIKQSPSKISYGSYVYLDKHLLLGIGSQVVTYLIAMMQFT